MVSFSQISQIRDAYFHHIQTIFVFNLISDKSNLFIDAACRIIYVFEREILAELWKYFIIVNTLSWYLFLVDVYVPQQKVYQSRFEFDTRTNYCRCII